MKKLKLSLSLCMMCLCIAVLCMGILALNSVEYNITGSMTYNATSDLALVNTRVYKIADQKTTTELETTATTLSTMTFEAIESSTDLNFILSQKLDTKATLSNGATSDEISAGSINIGFGATDSSVWYYTYYIVINITNLSSSGSLSATLTDNTTYTNVNNYILSSQTGISKGDTKNIVIALSLSDTTVESVNIDITYSLSIEFKNVGTFSITLSDSSDYDVTVEFQLGLTWQEFYDLGPFMSGSSYKSLGNGHYLSFEGANGYGNDCVSIYLNGITLKCVYYDSSKTQMVPKTDVIQSQVYYRGGGGHAI